MSLLVSFALMLHALSVTVVNRMIISLCSFISVEILPLLLLLCVHFNISCKSNLLLQQALRKCASHAVICLAYQALPNGRRGTMTWFAPYYLIFVFKSCFTFIDCYTLGE